MFQFMCEDDVY